MTFENIQSSSDGELVDSYARAASLHGKASEKGDHTAANKHYEVLAAIYRELRKRGKQAQLALLPLLESQDSFVKLWVASHALEFSPADGEPALLAMSEASGAGIPKFDALMTLKEWKKGALKFP